MSYLPQRFEPTLTPSLNSINSILKRSGAAGSKRAKEITPASIVERVI